MPSGLKAAAYFQPSLRCIYTNTLLLRLHGKSPYYIPSPYTPAGGSPRSGYIQGIPCSSSPLHTPSRKNLSEFPERASNIIISSRAWLSGTYIIASLITKASRERALRKRPFYMYCNLALCRAVLHNNLESGSAVCFGKLRSSRCTARPGGPSEIGSYLMYMCRNCLISL